MGKMGVIGSPGPKGQTGPGGPPGPPGTKGIQGPKVRRKRGSNHVIVKSFLIPVNKAIIVKILLTCFMQLSCH